MLHGQDHPMHLWAEAATKMVYVQNRTPHRVLENKTLEEIFSGKKPEVIRGNLGSKMGLIRKRAKISFCELEFKNQ